MEFEQTGGQTDGQTYVQTRTVCQIGAIKSKNLFFLKISLYFIEKNFKTFFLVQGVHQFPCWSFWNTFEKVVVLQTFTKKWSNRKNFENLRQTFFLLFTVAIDSLVF